MITTATRRFPNFSKLFLILLIILCANAIMAQKADKQKVNSLIKTADSLKDKDIDKSRLISLHSLDLSLKMNYDSGTGLAYKNLATLMMFQSDIRNSIDTYKKAITYFEKAHYTRGIADCYNNIALSFSVNSKFDSSMIFYQKNLELEELLNDKISIARTLENIGIAYYYQGYSKKAITHFLNATTIYYDLREFSLIYPNIVYISSVLSDMGYHRLSIRFHQIALIMAKFFNDTRVMSNCYNNIGFSYSNLGEHDKALEYLNYSLELKDQLQDKEGMMISLGIIGAIYQTQERYDLSNQVYTNIIKIAEEVDDKRQTAIGLTYIGENLRKQGKLDKAINYYLHSLDILKPIRALNEIRDNYMFLTYTYYLKKDPAQCKHCHTIYKAYCDSTQIRQ